MHKHVVPTLWQTVMFDPLAYIHPERLHLQPEFETPAQRAAINRLLIAHYRLDMPEGGIARGPAHKAGAAEICLLRNWLALPQIVFLLGCRRLHLSLLRRGGLLKLPASAQAFLTLPLPSTPQFVGQEAEPLLERGILDRALLHRHGVQQLRLALGRLPALLAQRLPLLFAPRFDDIASVAEANENANVNETNEAVRDPAHALTLMMAIQHVKRYPVSTR